MTQEGSAEEKERLEIRRAPPTCYLAHLRERISSIDGSFETVTFLVSAVVKVGNRVRVGIDMLCRITISDPMSLSWCTKSLASPTWTALVSLQEQRRQW